MMTAGIAATSPMAVASSASAMPGATTARLVVCDFEMPMKLFMIPQTVPKRPTNGAVEPMVASTPVPPISRFNAFEPRRDPFLDPVAFDGAGRELQFGDSCIEELPDLALRGGEPLH